MVHTTAANSDRPEQARIGAAWLVDAFGYPGGSDTAAGDSPHPGST